MPTPQPTPPQQTPRQQPGAGTQAPRPGAAPQPGGGPAQAPVPPGPPGGAGTLTQALFAGDHVLEAVAKGQGTLKQGARGPSVRAIQNFLLGQGLKLGRSGADGDWGDATTKALKSWQTSHGLGPDGVVGKDTLNAMDKSPAVPPPTPGAATPGTTPGTNAAAPGTAPAAPATPAAPPQPVATPGAATAPGATPAAKPATPATTSAPSAGPPGSKNGGLPQDFQKMWDVHPHNYQKDETQNTKSSDLQVAQGWSPEQYSNTCAIRLSVMFNQLGGALKITREKAKAAGLDPGRIPFSKKTGWYYILSAKEMWTYMSMHCGKPHAEFPAKGRFADDVQFQEKFDTEVAPMVAGKKGIVAFDKIFTFSGTGHVDLFDGMKLSDANTWYPSQALKLWFV